MLLVNATASRKGPKQESSNLGAQGRRGPSAKRPHGRPGALDPNIPPTMEKMKP